LLIDLESILNYPIPNRHRWATSRPAARPSTVSKITLVYKECRRIKKGVGHFFGALRIDGFMGPDEFKRRIDEWVRVSARPESLPKRPGLSSPVTRSE
jgi:hypothetical protein